MSGTLEIPLEDLKDWLKQETVSIIEPLEAERKNLLDKIDVRLEDIKAACEKLLEDAEKEMEKGSRKTYRRSRVAYKLASNVLDTIDKATVPDQISYELFRAFCEDLEKILATFERERARWFPIISPFFIIDRRRIDVALKRAIDSFKELRSFSLTKYEEAKTVQDSFSMIDELRDLLSKLEEMRKRKKKMESRAQTIEKKMADSLKRRDQLQSRSQVVELDQVKKTIKELRKDVKHSMRYLQKPFIKFQNLVRGPGYPLPLNEAKKLGEYLSNPFKAFATEKEGYPVLKEILKKMEDAIAQGKLKLKTSRLRKAKKQINNVLRKEALTPLQQKCIEAHSQRLKLSTSDAIAIFQSKLSKVQDSLKDLQKKKELHDSTRAALDEKIEKTREKIESQRRTLEKIALELTGKDIRLVIPQG